MRPISLKLRAKRAELASGRCIVAGGHFGSCSGRIQWHHPFRYGGDGDVKQGQINELWALAEVCEYHHRLLEGNSKLKWAIEVACVLQATEDDLAKYRNKDWKEFKRKQKYLESIGIDPQAISRAHLMRTGPVFKNVWDK